MMQMLRPVFALLIVSTVLLGGVYPAVVTLVAQWAFPVKANGSLIKLEETAVGSKLIGQEFSSKGYFWGRPSATSERPYNPMGSGASNLGAANPALYTRIETRVAELRKHHSDPTTPVPIDLVTASASGLDPHISVGAAEYQITRVAKARKMTVDQVRDLVKLHTQPRFLGVFGEPVVHVLSLNMALDQQSRKGKGRQNE